MTCLFDDKSLEKMKISLSTLSNFLSGKKKKPNEGNIKDVLGKVKKTLESIFPFYSEFNDYLREEFDSETDDNEELKVAFDFFKDGKPELQDSFLDIYNAYTRVITRIDLFLMMSLDEMKESKGIEQVSTSIESIIGKMTEFKQALENGTEEIKSRGYLCESTSIIHDVFYEKAKKNLEVIINSLFLKNGDLMYRILNYSEANQDSLSLLYEIEDNLAGLLPDTDEKPSWIKQININDFLQDLCIFLQDLAKKRIQIAEVIMNFGSEENTKPQV